MLTETKKAMNFQVVINNTNPLYFYCTQPTLTHCKRGMVGAVNGNITAYKLAANQSTTLSAPPRAYGGLLVAAASNSTGNASTTTTGGTPTTTPTGTASRSAVPSVTTGAAALVGAEMGLAGALGAVALGFVGLV